VRAAACINASRLRVTYKEGENEVRGEIGGTGERRNRREKEREKKRRRREARERIGGSMGGEKRAREVRARRGRVGAVRLAIDRTRSRSAADMEYVIEATDS
jgi:hypothetical protein